MPRKTKDTGNEEINKEKDIKKTKKASISKTKKDVAKKEESKSSKSNTKKTTVQAKNKKTTTTKKNTDKASKATKKTSTKSTKTTAKKKTAKKTTLKKVEKVNLIEYYDLPTSYNKTVIKLLAQTPNTLFVYWELSLDDVDKFKKQYGDNFFETTKPVLIVHNDSLNYSFEVEINDFANSWYLHVNDAKSDYRIEIGRRPIHSISNIKEDYIYITSSNEIEAPNDRILFDKSQKMVYFKNTKTNKKIGKDVSISFIKNMGKVYNIYDLYKEFYNKENIDELYNLSNPSSSNPSSKF